MVVFAGSMAVGRVLSGYLANKTLLNNIMIGSAVLGVIASALIPSAVSLAGFYGLLILAGLATACFWPSILAEADQRLTVNTTILFVLLACFGIIGFGSTPLIMGLIGDNTELKTGFTVIPVLFGALILVTLAERKALSRSANSQ